MKHPDMDEVRDLLKAKDFKTIAEMEPRIIEYCEYKIKYSCNEEGYSIQSLFLNTICNLESAKKKNSKDPLPEYCMSLVSRLMGKYRLIRIDDYQDIQDGDATFYIWKNKGKTFFHTVDVLEVYKNQKAKIRYSHQHHPLDGFDHTFKPNNFKFAIRQLASSKKEANTKYTFFFFKNNQ